MPLKKLKAIIIIFTTTASRLSTTHYAEARIQVGTPKGPESHDPRWREADISRLKPSGKSYGRIAGHEKNTVERILDRNLNARQTTTELGRVSSAVNAPLKIVRLPPMQEARPRSRKPFRLFAPPPHSWSASASITAFTTCSARRLSSSCMSMAPSPNRGMASMSGVGSNKITIAVFVLSQNLLLW